MDGFPRCLLHPVPLTWLFICFSDGFPSQGQDDALFFYPVIRPAWRPSAFAKSGLLIPGDARHLHSLTVVIVIIIYICVQLLINNSSKRGENVTENCYKLMCMQCVRLQ